MARDLSAFFKIANVINSTRDVQAMQCELLALICEVIPAAQGAIVLQLNRNEEPSAAVYLESEGAAGDADSGRNSCSRRPGNNVQFW